MTQTYAILNMPPHNTGFPFSGRGDVCLRGTDCPRMFALDALPSGGFQPQRYLAVIENTADKNRRLNKD